MNSSLVGVIDEALRHDEIEGVYGAINGILGILNRSIVNLKTGRPFCHCRAPCNTLRCPGFVPSIS